MGEQRLGGPAPVYYIGRELKEDEFIAYIDATKSLGRHATARQLIEITRINYRAYQETLRRFEEEYAQDHLLNWQRADEIVTHVNCSILNFLTAQKTLLDHTQTRLHRTYGPDSNQFKQYKACEHAAFDNNFSYRFLSKLRNYTQHCGMPLGYVNASSHLEGVPGGPVRHAIDFYFDRESLLKNFSDWGKHVEPGLRALPDQFPIRPHLETTMNCLEEISNVTVGFSEPHIRQALGVVDPLLAEIELRDGTPGVITALEADAKAVPGKIPINMSFQRFQMKHLEVARRILAEIEGRRAAVVDQAD
jgi:hypothetical protein